METLSEIAGMDVPLGVVEWRGTSGTEQSKVLITHFSYSTLLAAHFCGCRYIVLLLC